MVLVDRGRHAALIVWESMNLCIWRHLFLTLQQEVQEVWNKTPGNGLTEEEEEEKDFLNFWLDKDYKFHFYSNQMLFQVCGWKTDGLEDLSQTWRGGGVLQKQVTLDLISLHHKFIHVRKF